MSRNVAVHPRGQADMYRIVRSIGRSVSAASAGRWKGRVESAIGALAADADTWPEADEAADLGRDIRCRLFGRRPHVYRILFIIDGDTVSVLRVRHAAQDRLAPHDI